MRVPRLFTTLCMIAIASFIVPSTHATSCQVKKVPHIIVDNPGVEVLHEHFSTWGNFVMDLRNDDSSDCGNAKFTVGVTTPDGWGSSVDPGSVFYLMSGHEQIVKVFLTIPQSAMAGNYSVTAKVTNMSTNYFYTWTWYVVVKDNPPGTDSPTPTPTTQPAAPTATPMPASNTSTTTQYTYPTKISTTTQKTYTVPTKKLTPTPKSTPTPTLTPIQRLKAGMVSTPTPTLTPEEEISSRVSSDEVPKISFQSIIFAPWINLYQKWKQLFVK